MYPSTPRTTYRVCFGVTFLLAALMLASEADAIPSFARQTGVACATCHTTSFGPNLTPYGREFKLNGYVWGAADGRFPPLSGMILGSFTNTQKDQLPPPGPAARGYNANDNFALDSASLFYGGRIWDKLGAFSQLTYDGVEDRIALDNTDIRYANQLKLADQDIVFGISANDAPTVQDVWNTTPAWGFPYASSPLAGVPGAAAMIDGGLGTGQVGGATLYAMVERLLYIEGGAYTTFARNVQRSIGTWILDQNRIDGGAPYWRVALQHEVDGHYVALGHYGMRANVFPGGNRSNGSDRYTDLAVDATYQYLGDLKHIFELKGTYIRENQELFASRLAGDTVFSRNQLNTFKINAAYTFVQTYSLNFGYHRITGTRNTGIYNTDAGFALSGRPDSEYYIVELDYVPFGKESSLLSTLLNLRVGLQYVGYNKFNGTAQHAGDYNTLMLNGWLAF